MANNWNSILSNTNNLRDVLVVLQKVLSLLDNKVDLTVVNEALENIDGMSAELQQAINDLLNNDFMEPFATEVELLKSTPILEKKAAKALDTKKVWLWDGGEWNDTGKSELDLAKEFANANALFKPIRLDGTVPVENITSEGFYHIPTDAIAKTLGLPDGKLGKMWCGGYTQPPTSGFVFHELVNRSGDTYFNYLTADGWMGWDKGGRRKVISNVTELNALGNSLDDLTSTESYFFGTGSIVTSAFGFPLTGFGGYLDVQTNAAKTTCHQRQKTHIGTVHRYGVKNTTTNDWDWIQWSGYKNTNGGIVDFKDFLVSGKSLSKVVTVNTEFNLNIDNFFEEAEFYINNSALASTANGFPITGSGGFFSSKKNASGAIIHKWETYNGWAYRWGNISTKVWQPWHGFINATNAIIDIAKVQAEKTKLMVYGSSTMWYLSDEMTDLATRYNLDFKNHGISGDTSYGAGQAQGSNVVTLQFTTGVITNGSNTPTIESSFGGVARHNRTIELSNGVKGTLRTDGTFVTSNLTADLTVSATEKFRLYEYAWYDLGVGVYVIDIGKNDVSSSTDNSADILDRTLQIINYVPKGSKVLVGGHFSNTNSTDMHRTVVEKINEALRLKFGLRYFDINELLFDEATWTELGLTKTAEDITAIEQRRKPPSLSRDDAHLSEAMDKILARSIENKLLSLGYI